MKSAKLWPKNVKRWVGLLKRSKIGLLVLVLGLAACSEQGRPLTEEQIARHLKKEKTILWSGFGFSGEAMFAPNGEAIVRVPNTGEDKGTWHQRGGSLCTKWEKIAGGREVCGRIARLADGAYEVRDVTTKARLGKFDFKKDE